MSAEAEGTEQGRSIRACTRQQSASTMAIEPEADDQAHTAQDQGPTATRP